MTTAKEIVTATLPSRLDACADALRDMGKKTGKNLLTLGACIEAMTEASNELRSRGEDLLP